MATFGPFTVRSLREIRKRITDAVERPEGALKSIGALMVAESSQAFKSQRLGATDWRERMNPNVPGIISDFYRGKPAPPGRRFEPRPVLQDSGLLKGSFSFRVINAKTVEAGTRLPYAGILHTGGESQSDPITKDVQERLGKWLTGKGKAHQADLGWLLGEHWTDQRLTINHPARPMVRRPQNLSGPTAFGIAAQLGDSR